MFKKYMLTILVLVAFSSVSFGQMPDDFLKVSDYVKNHSQFSTIYQSSIIHEMRQQLVLSGLKCAKLPQAPLNVGDGKFLDYADLKEKKGSPKIRVGYTQNGLIILNDNFPVSR